MGALTPRAAATPPLRSRHWYRVRALRPRWRDGLSVSRQRQRSGVWHVVGLDGIGRRVRLNEAAWAIVGRFDGRLTLDEIWTAVAAREAGRLPPQDDLVAVIGRLVAEGLLECGDWPDLDAVVEDDRRHGARRRRERLNPLAPRIALLDPDRLLDRLSAVAAACFSRPGAWFVATLWLLAAVVGLASLEALAAHWQQRFAGWSDAWLMLACFIPIKAVHELAHGMAVRRFGGRVREAGLALLLGFPAPYVDASAADDFASARERALVSAAGIVTELTLAAIALLAWSVLAPGLLRDACLAAMTIAGLSTLLLNGNPLVRLDGYYVLTDLARLPALAERSGAWWRAVSQRGLLGLPVTPPLPADGERLGWMVYAPAAWLYRASLMAWLATWIGGHSRVLGLAVGAAALVWLVLLPVARLVRAPVRTTVTVAQRMAAWSRLAGACAVLLAVGLVPLPERAWAPAVAWLPDGARVRVEADGTVAEVLVAEGGLVEAGTPIGRLSDPDLEARIRATEALVDERTRAWRARLHARADDVAAAREQLRQAEQRLAHLRGRGERLVLRAQGTGRLHWIAAAHDLPGRYLRTGTLVAVVDGGPPGEMRALIDQPTLARLRAVAGAASAMAVLPGGRTAQARILEGEAAAVQRLPDAGFAHALGGAIDAEPVDDDAWAPRVPVYPLTLRLPDHAGPPPGVRLWVRLDLGRRALFAQWASRVRETLEPRLAPDWS